MAAHWDLATETARVMEKRSLQRWAASRSRPAIRYVCVDALFLGKEDKFLTVVSKLTTRDRLCMGKDRKRGTLDRFFAEALLRNWRRSIQVVCLNMWELYALRLRAHLPRARTVYDKFDVLKHANAAVDETLRAEFFRRGSALRGLVQRKRWLLLTRWHHLTAEKREMPSALFAVNGRLAGAYLLRE